LSSGEIPGTEENGGSGAEKALAAGCPLSILSRPLISSANCQLPE
jgi:hypothetical protein